MSYSRWSNSVWYTYWCAGADNNHRRSQLFDICGVITFTAGEIIDDIEKCLDTACDKSKINNDHNERDELRNYMMEFITDVNNDNQLIGNKLIIK